MEGSPPWPSILGKPLPWGAGTRDSCVALSPSHSLSEPLYSHLQLRGDTPHCRDAVPGAGGLSLLTTPHLREEPGEVGLGVGASFISAVSVPPLASCLSPSFLINSCRAPSLRAGVPGRSRSSRPLLRLYSGTATGAVASRPHVHSHRWRGPREGPRARSRAASALGGLLFSGSCVAATSLGPGQCRLWASAPKAQRHPRPACS